MEGIIDLLSGIDSELVHPRTLLGIGRIPSLEARDAGQTDPLDSRHVVLVFDSEQTAERLYKAINAAASEQDPESAVRFLIQRGCKARTMWVRKDALVVRSWLLLVSPELKTLKSEYLDYQARTCRPANLAPERKVASRPVPHSAGPLPIHPEKAESTAQFPLDCLIYLQNLPDNTNKTEIKAKLDVYLEGGNVDYVDWKKGQISVGTSLVPQAP
jgi:hypothetical protein